MNSTTSSPLPPMDPHGARAADAAEWQRICINAVGSCVARMQRYVELLCEMQPGDEYRAELLHGLDTQTRQLNYWMRRAIASGEAAPAGSALPPYVSLQLLLAAVLDEYRLLSPGHRFRLDLPAVPLVGAAIAPYIQIIFEMLLDNAVRCGPTASEIEVAGCPAPGDDGWTFHIRDHGAGIAPERLAALFDDPSQAGPTAVYGLAISLAKQLVEALGGRMWVESRVGQGASFSFSLSKEILLRRWMVPRPKVLVIDDDAQLCAELKASFEAAGFEVETAQSRDEGLVLAQAFGPQVVVIELVASPHEKQASFESLLTRTDAAVICLSSLEDRAAVADALWQGATDCVPKPFHVRELIARTRAILRRRQMAPRADSRAWLYPFLSHPPRVDPMLQ